jgi:hypothetical protein
MDKEGHVQNKDSCHKDRAEERQLFIWLQGKSSYLIGIEFAV